MDIGIKFRKKYDVAQIVPVKKNKYAQEIQASEYSMIYHFDKQLPVFGKGAKKYFFIVLGQICEPFSGFICADDRRKANKILDEVITKKLPDVKIMHQHLYEVI